MEGVKDCDRVGQPVADRVRVATERIQAAVSTLVDKPVRLGVEPSSIDRAGTTHHGVQESGVKASGLVTGSDRP